MIGYRTLSFNRAYIPAHKGTGFYTRSIKKLRTKIRRGTLESGKKEGTGFSDTSSKVSESLGTNAHWVFNKLTGHLVVSIDCLVKYCQSASRRLVGGILKFKAVWKNQESPWLQPGECQ